MLVVVQTYPAHFYQTLLCLRSIHQTLQPPQVLLIIDDSSTLCWPGYVEHCNSVYAAWLSDIKLTSDVSSLRFLRRYPWLRQQTTKLLLDTVIDQDRWLFVDGDVALTQIPPLDSVPASRIKRQGVPLNQRDPVPGEMSSQVLFYIRHMLGIDFDGFWDTDDSGLMITSSHPPVHTMRRDVLRALRSDIEDRFRSPLAIVHKNLAQDTRIAASEWDLIECYRQTVMGEPANWYWGDGFCETTWSSDRELGLQWFLDREIPVDPGIWKILPDRKYF